MKRVLLLPITLAGALICVGCIELDFFLFETESADSVEGDYHGLPLYQGDTPPPWVNESTVERELYLQVPGGNPISPATLEDASSYIHGVFLPAPTDCPIEECPLAGEGVTFLYQHGNSGNMFRYWYRAVYLWSTGANVFIYTYRGYGLSSGEASRQHVIADGDAAMAYLVTRDDVNQDRIFAYGYSMGGIPTSYLVGKSAHRTVFRGAILEAALDTPDSTADLSAATDTPEGFFLDADHPYNGPVFLRGATLPMLHMHGDRDDRVLRAQAGRYFDVLAGRVDYTHIIGRSDNPAEGWMEGVNHRNMPHHAFAAGSQIADYWDHDNNPHHCCIHPAELLLEQNAPFLTDVGHTTGEDAYASYLDYRNLISGWVLQTLR